MSLYSIKGPLINLPSCQSWENLFQALSTLLTPIINKGEEKLLIFHYSNEKELEEGMLSWTTNFVLDPNNITDSTGIVPNEGYKYVHIALVTVKDEDTEISFSQNKTKIGGYEILLNFDSSQRENIAILPITTN